MPNEQSDQLEIAYKLGKEITQKQARSFYLGSVFLPKRLRDDVYLLYAYCRHVDNLVDEAADADSAKIALNNFKLELFEALKSGQSQDPILFGLIYIIHKYHIDPQLPLELIAGVEMDLVKNRYQNYSELDRYCYLVASVVGLMMVKIIGSSSEKANEYAIKLGKAMQITNILRDIKEDYDLGRIYIPEDDLKKFDYPENFIASGKQTKSFENLVKHYVQLAQEYYESSLHGIQFLSKDSRLAILIASNNYRDILNQIQRENFQVLKHRVYVPNWRKAWIVFKSWIQFNLMPQAG